MAHGYVRADWPVVCLCLAPLSRPLSPPAAVIKKTVLSLANVEVVEGAEEMDTS